MRAFAIIAVILAANGLAPAGPSTQPIDQILVHYYKIQKSLAADSTQGVDTAAKEIVRIASTAKATTPTDQKTLQEVKKAAQEIQGKDLKSAREHFFDLSKPLLACVHQSYQGEKKPYRYYCSMANKAWIQPDKEVRNPYYGSSMLTCGEPIE